MDRIISFCEFVVLCQSFEGDEFLPECAIIKQGWLLQWGLQVWSFDGSFQSFRWNFGNSELFATLEFFKNLEFVDTMLSREMASREFSVHKTRGRRVPNMVVWEQKVSEELVEKLKWPL